MSDNNDNISFEELFNNSVKDFCIGKTVTGRVIAITGKDEIIVDIGYKADGIIPKQEYSFNENDNPREQIKIGDEITADVLKMNDGVGNVLLSYKRTKLRNAKKDFEEKVEKGQVFEEKITDISDKGLITNYKGIRIFIPISLSGINRTENIEDYRGAKVKFKIVQYNEKERKIIGSIKAVKDEEKEEKLKNFWEEAEVGKEYEGRVTSISAYGAFIDLGTVQGLLHISEMSWGRNVSPNDILKLDQIIKVKAIDVDKKNRRIKLTYVEKGPDPWKEMDKKYKINDIVEVKVVKFMPFGVFVQIEPGIEGLVHVSQIAEKRITNPEEVLVMGQKVNAKIINIDKENKKMELSIRELEGTSNEYKEEINK